MHKITNDRMKWGLGAILVGVILAGVALARTWDDNRAVRGFTGKPMRVLRPKQHVRILAVALSRCGTLLATAGYDHEEPEGDNSVCLWDLQTGRMRHALMGHRNGVCSLTFSPSGDTVVSGSYDKTLKLWDTQTGRLRRTLGGQCGYVHSVACSPNGRFVVSAEQTAVNVWDANTGRLTHQIKGRPDEQLLSAAYSPDGKLLATVAHIGIQGSSGEVNLWDAQTYRLLRRFTGCSSLAFSPDGAVLAADGGDTDSLPSSWGVYLWDVETGRMRTRVPGGARGMAPLAFVYGGRTLVTGGDTIQMWNCSSGSPQRQLKGGEYGFSSFAVSASGKILAGACDGEPGVKLWRLR